MTVPAARTRLTFDLSGQRLLVTGGGTGIGQAVAVAAARNGAAVMVTGRRLEMLDRTCELAGPVATPVVPFVGDVTDPQSAQAIVSASVDRWGGLDGFVNAAGVTDVRPTEDVTDDDFRNVLEPNLVGAFRMTREVGRVMLASGRGSIVHIGSIAGFGGFPGRAAYTISKHGLAGLVSAVGAEWAPRGVRVNSVAPGFVRTDMNQRIEDKGLLDIREVEARTPLARRAATDEVVGAVIFLLTEGASYIVGQSIIVDGGWMAHAGPVSGVRGRSVPR